jgi:hypothetical protein
MDAPSALLVIACLMSAIIGAACLDKLQKTDEKMNRLLEADEAIKKLHKRVDVISYCLQREYIRRT